MDDRPRLSLVERANAVISAWDAVWLSPPPDRPVGALDLAGLRQAVEQLRSELSIQPKALW
jgi:hypothetical protein